MSGQRLESTLRDVTLGSVYTKTVGADSKTMWVVEADGDGPEITTFKGELGNKARAFFEAGTVVDMVVTIAQNGKFTNYYLEKVQASKEQPDNPVRRAAQQAQAAQPAQNEMSFAQFAAQANQERTSIHRQVAAKVAASLVTPTDGPADFWANAEAILGFFETGIVPGAVRPSQTLPTGVTSHPEPELPPPLSDDDIPF